MTTERYFYTTHYVNRWTSGPTHNTGDPDNHWQPIHSLEKAKEIAARFSDPDSPTDRCLTTYGVEYVD